VIAITSSLERRRFRLGSDSARFLLNTTTANCFLRFSELLRDRDLGGLCSEYRGRTTFAFRWAYNVP
jgi:hypothetical protein